MRKLEKELIFRMNELNSATYKAVVAEYILLLRELYRKESNLFTEEIISNINDKSDKFGISESDFTLAKERLKSDTFHKNWEKRCNNDGSIKSQSGGRAKSKTQNVVLKTPPVIPVDTQTRSSTTNPIKPTNYKYFRCTRCGMDRVSKDKIDKGLTVCNECELSKGNYSSGEMEKCSKCNRLTIPRFMKEGGRNECNYCIDLRDAPPPKMAEGGGGSRSDYLKAKNRRGFKRR